MSQRNNRMMMRAAVMLGAMGLAGASAQAEVFVAPLGPGGDYRVYQTINTSLTWTAAQADAQTRLESIFGIGTAGRLVRVDSAAENAFVQAISQGSNRWLGGTDQTTEGTWYWVDNTGADNVHFWNGSVGGTPVAGVYANWNGGEPNNSGNEDYVEMRAGDGLWNDLNSTQSKFYVVQWDIGPSLVDATTTGDPIYLDPATGRYVQRTTTSQIWDTSKALAESRQLNGVQGRLVQVESAGYSQFLGSIGGGWAGLTDNELFGGSESQGQANPQQNGWVWSGPINTSGIITNTALGAFTNWNGGEPNNSSGAEDYMEISNSLAGGWNDNNGGTQSRAALIQFDGVAADLNVKVIAVNGTAAPGGSATDIRNLINSQSARTGFFEGQFAAVSFSDPQNAASTTFANRVAFPNNTNSDDNNFAAKAYLTVDIDAAGDYTFGVNHDDAYELVVDRGAGAVTAVNAAGTATTLTTVHFDAPGQYNIYALVGESGGGSSLQLFAAAGDFGGQSVAAAQGNGAVFHLVGDSLNGGLATAKLRDIGAMGGFHVVRKNGTVGNLAATDTLLDNGAIVGVSDDFKVINFLDTSSNGHFGADNLFPGATAGDDNNYAVEATTRLLVDGNSAGWWTFAVNSDDGFRLDIVGADFASFAGDVGTAIVGGNLEFNAGRGTDDSFGSIYLAAGIYDLNLRYWEGTGGSALELYYAAGVHTSFDGSFDLLTAIPLPGAGVMGFAMMLGMASVKRFRRGV